MFLTSPPQYKELEKLIDVPYAHQVAVLRLDISESKIVAMLVPKETYSGQGNILRDRGVRKQLRSL